MNLFATNLRWVLLGSSLKHTQNLQRPTTTQDGLGVARKAVLLSSGRAIYCYRVLPPPFFFKQESLKPNYGFELSSPTPPDGVKRFPDCIRHRYKKQ